MPRERPRFLGGRTSLRFRLTLWNVAVLGLVLIGFGAAVCTAVDVTLRAAVDRELHERARVVGTRWLRGEMPGAPGWMPPDRRFGPGPGGQFGQPGEARPGPEVPVQPVQFGPSQPGQPGPGSPEQPYSQRRGIRREPAEPAGLRRPRIFGRDGRPLQPDGDAAFDDGAVQVALGGKVDLRDVVVDAQHLRVLTVPLRGFGNPAGPPPGLPPACLQVAQPLTEIDGLNAGVLRAMLMLGPLVLLVAAVGGIFLTDRALRPVRDLTRAAANLSERDLSLRLEVVGDDELAELAGTFNGMLGRLAEAFDRLARAYEQERRFSADASHELRTPLTIIKANTSLALRGARSAEEYREALVEADAAADTMARIVQDLLLLARSDAGQLRSERSEVALDELVPEVSRSVQDGFGATVAPISWRPSVPGLRVLGDEHQLARMLANLLRNALRHTPTDGQIRVEAHPDGEMIALSVTDTGEGIPAEHLPHIGERFYRVDTARARASGGTGLGLAICRSIAEAHGGTLEIASAVGVGTCVTVRLPAYRRAVTNAIAGSEFPVTAGILPASPSGD